MSLKPNADQLSVELQSDITGVKKYQNYWLVIGETGKWVAKPIRDQQHHAWWSGVEQELRYNGFHSFPKTKQVDGWLLSQYIDGRSPSYKDRHTALTLMQTLARFHLYGRQLHTPPMKQAAYLLSDRLFDRLDEFYYYLIYGTKRTEKMEYLLSHYGPLFYHHANEAYQVLSEKGLADFAALARDQHMLTHRDLANHNWIIDTNQQVWLIDFDTMEYDLQVGDVWQICSRILTAHQWDFALFQQLISAYESVKPLYGWERELLACLFRFPNEFLRETIGILEKKEGYNEKQTIPYLEKIAFDYPIWLQRVGQMNTWLCKG